MLRARVSGLKGLLIDAVVEQEEGLEVGRTSMRGECSIVLVLRDIVEVTEPLNSREGLHAILGGGRRVADDGLVVLRDSYLGLIDSDVVGAEAEDGGWEGAGFVFVEESRDPWILLIFVGFVSLSLAHTVGRVIVRVLCGGAAGLELL